MDCSDIISLIVVELATDLAKHQGFPSEPARCINLEVDCAADGKARNPDVDEQDGDAVPLALLSSAVECKRFAVDEGKELPDAFAVTVSSGHCARVSSPHIAEVLRLASVSSSGTLQTK